MLTALSLASNIYRKPGTSELRLTTEAEEMKAKAYKVPDR